MRFGHWVVLQLGNRAPCAALPPPKAPPLRRGALAVGAIPSRPPTTSAWTLSSREKSSSLCGLRASFCDAQGSQTKPPRRQTKQAAARKKTSLKNLQAGNSAEFSKPQIPLPDREFESVPLRQLVFCFCGDILLRAIFAEYPQGGLCGNPALWRGSNQLLIVAGSK
jgi:hypothetical protein